jgi:uncharacterized protein (TIGR02001 family)
VQSVFRSAFCAALWTICSAPIARADNDSLPNHWPAPFGGRFHAAFTVASDYAQAGISNTQLGPAFQASLDYRSPNLLPKGDPPLWIYGYVFGSNVSFPTAGNGMEIDVASGLKLRLMEGKLALSLGYTRHTFPGIAASFGLEYGEVEGKADYDFGPVTVSGRLRYSPNGLGGIGQSWDKRALVSAPLPFPRLPFDASMKLYGTLGDFWGEKPEAVGLPAHDYLYWQIGLVTSVWGLDVTAAYTDTSIQPEGCGNTRLCEGRVFLSVTKVF